MQKQIVTFISCMLFTGMATAHSGKSTTDYLRECLKKQMPAEGQVLRLHYEEKQNQTYHSPEPWQTYGSASAGTIWCNGDNFIQLDTVAGKDKPHVSKLQWGKGELLAQSYWSDKISNPSQSELDEQPLELARYTPLPLLRYFSGKKIQPKLSTEYATYSDMINGAVVSVQIRRSDFVVDRITILRNHDIWGDVETKLTYGNYAAVNSLKYAQLAIIEKVHGIKDTVTCAGPVLEREVPHILLRPQDYKTEPDEKKIPTVTTEKLRDHIYSIGMPHTESMALLVEFKTFFVAIDVPLNSENGELVLAEARKIALGKPVKYYAFGHHHPWALGGVRPFIHNGTTILTLPRDVDYVTFIADAKHTLKPDSLQLQPKTVQIEQMDSVKTISDGETELRILYIGEQSRHTKDYLIFYFPKEKLVFEGDLAWVAKDGTLKKASERQAGLYQAIKDRGIAVDTVVQQWPMGDRYKLKSIFPFSELEQSVQIK